MTTVGYGDRVAKTYLGKIFTIIWMLAGLVIFGILSGYLATVLTNVTMVNTGDDVLLYGTEVAAVQDSAEYRLGIRMNARVNIKKKPLSFEDVYSMLINKEVQGALIETYAIGARKDLFEKPNLRIVKIFDHSSVFGVVMGGVSRKLQKCFYGYMQMFRAEIFKQIEGNIDSIKTSTKSLAAERTAGLFDAGSPVFQKTVAVIGGLLLVAFLIGTLWECLINRKRQAAALTEYRKCDELREEVSRFVEEFKSNAGRRKAHFLKELSRLKGKNYKIETRL